MSLSRLASALGHEFKTPSLLETALTHRSHGMPHNERLEFLGDSVLNCVVATMLYTRYPELPEGDLSRLRANLVRQDSLHRLAQSLRLGELLRLGEGELRSGGHQRPSILADCLEAIIGAIYLDGGFAAAALVLNRLYIDLLDEFRPGQSAKDAKTRLQEWLQGRRKPVPRYALVEATGAAHARLFEVVCEIESMSLRTVGKGTSRRLAEQAAADLALKELKA